MLSLFLIRENFMRSIRIEYPSENLHDLEECIKKIITD
jgi:hypothetical protein